MNQELWNWIWDNKTKVLEKDMKAYEKSKPKEEPPVIAELEKEYI